jgi:hypothetical protein
MIVASFLLSTDEIDSEFANEVNDNNRINVEIINFITV